jgi:hypothetical protein
MGMEMFGEPVGGAAGLGSPRHGQWVPSAGTPSFVSFIEREVYQGVGGMVGRGRRLRSQISMRLIRKSRTETDSILV